MQLALILLPGGPRFEGMASCGGQTGSGQKGGGSMTRMDSKDWVFVYVHLNDPRVKPLFAALAQEYALRSGVQYQVAENQLYRYPPREFEPPFGAFVLLLDGGRTVAGGAFRKQESGTAEVRRLWTHPDHRRKGLGRAVLAELESEARFRGYWRICAVTTPHQPEMAALCLSAGYVLLDEDHGGGRPRTRRFAKALAEVR